MNKSENPGPSSFKDQQAQFLDTNLNPPLVEKNPQILQIQEQSLATLPAAHCDPEFQFSNEVILIQENQKLKKKLSALKKAIYGDKSQK